MDFKPYKGYKAKRRIELDNSDIADIKLNFPLILKELLQEFPEELL